MIYDNDVHPCITPGSSDSTLKSLSVDKGKINPSFDPEKYDYFHVVAKPNNLSVKRFYLYYYILLIKLFILSKKNHAYDFIDYKYYIKLAISKILKINGE